MADNQNIDNHDAISQMDEFIRDRDEYIRSLESAVEILQREVEHLRARQSAGQTEDTAATRDTKTQVDTGRFYSAASESDVVSLLHKSISKKFGIVESNIYFFSPEKQLMPAWPDSSAGLNNTINHMEEEGIIDWAVEQKKPAVLPDLGQSGAEAQSFLVLIPIFLRGKEIGIFAGVTSRQPSEFDHRELDELFIIAGHAAAALDNIRSSQEITRMNRRLNTLNSQMLESSKYYSVGELTASIAREIESPVDIIEANLKLIETGVSESPRRYELIREQLDKLRIIHAKLDELTSAGGQQSPAELNICSVINDVILFSSAQMQRDGIRFEREYEDDSLTTNGLKPQLEQAFLNIMLSSRDTMPDGGTISIGVYPAERNRISININDTGEGIDEKQRSKIFNPNFTLSEESDKHSRGLFLSYSIIRQHRGSVSVVSQPGKGATYKILLPRAT
jgi:signal transduction histidine kinase